MDVASNLVSSAKLEVAPDTSPQTATNLFVENWFKRHFLSLSWIYFVGFYTLRCHLGTSSGFECRRLFPYSVLRMLYPLHFCFSWRDFKEVLNWNPNLVNRCTSKFSEISWNWFYVVFVCNDFQLNMAADLNRHLLHLCWALNNWTQM